MEMGIAELIKEKLLINRPEHTNVVKYSNYEGNEVYEATYSDSSQSYEIKTSRIESRKVRSAKAFIDLIKEELRRRNNQDGKFATVQLNLDGGLFCADENKSAGFATYERLHSEQYLTLNCFRDKVLTHEEFLIMLQKLKPSIVEFPSVFKAYSKIRLIGQSKLTSNPVFDENGQAESSFICNYKLSDGTDSEDISLPASFSLKLPFTKADDYFYEFTVELLFYNTNSNQIAVRVQVPCWEAVEEQAIIDEAAFIKNELSECKELLVLADF